VSEIKSRLFLHRKDFMRYLFGCLFCVGALSGPAISAQEEKPVLPDEVAASKAVLTLDHGGHVGPIRQVLFSADAKRLVTCGVDKTVQIWDVTSGERLKVLRPPVDSLSGGIIRTAALAPDGKTLAVGAAGFNSVPGGKSHLNQAYLLNLEDGRILPLPEVTFLVDVLAFSADGNRLAVCTRGDTVWLWKDLKNVWQTATSGPRLIAWKAQKIWDKSNRCDALAFAPDGKRLAVTLSGGAVTLVWDIESANGFATALHLSTGGQGVSAGHALAWSHDGKRLATCNHPPASAVRIWSEDGTLQHEFNLNDFRAAYKRANSSFYHSSAFFRPGSDHEVVLIGAVDLQMRTVMLLNLQATSVRKVFLDDPETGRVSFELPGAVSPDGNLVALPARRNGNGIFLVDLTGKEKTRQLGGRSHPVQVAWSKQGATIAWTAKGKDKEMDRGLDLENLQLLHRINPTHFVKEIRARDGWTVQRKVRPDGYGGIDILHDGKVKSAGAIGAWEPGKQWTFPASGEVSWLAWTAKERLFLADPRVGPREQKPIVCAPGLTAYYALASSPDGQYLLASSTREMFHIYRPASKQRTALLMAFVFGEEWIVWTQEGYYAATPGGEKLMGWTVNNGPNQVATFHPAERFRKQLHRPDVVKLVLEKGNVKEALKVADAARGKVSRDIALDDLLPPTVTLTLLDQSKLPTVTVKVQAQASSKQQPISALRLLINGRPAPGKATLIEYRDGKQQAEVEWTFALEEGDNQLAAMARSPDSTNVSRSIPIKNINRAKLPVLHVLTVGINEYQDNSLDLKFAVPDAVALAAGFQKHCGQAFRAVNCRTLLNSEATTPEILRELRDLRKTVAQQDLVVVFFACHGVKHEKEYYLLTREANIEQLGTTSLSGDELRKTLSEYKCQVLLLLDACHAAGFGAGKKLSKRGLRPATDDLARDLTENDCGVAVMCAAMGHEKAEGVAGFGLFTKALIEALEKGPTNPFNQRQYVHHLQSYVFDQVSHHSKDRQHPFLNLPWVVESFVIR
jgi:WD40 repeat protein